MAIPIPQPIVILQPIVISQVAVLRFASYRFASPTHVSPCLRRAVYESSRDDGFLQNSVLDGKGRVGYTSFLCPSGGMADAAVSKTVVSRRASSNLASGTIRKQSELAKDSTYLGEFFSFTALGDHGLRSKKRLGQLSGRSTPTTQTCNTTLPIIHVPAAHVGMLIPFSFQALVCMDGTRESWPCTFSREKGRACRQRPFGSTFFEEMHRPIPQLQPQSAFP